LRLSSLQWIRVGLPLSLVSVFSFFVSISPPNVDAQPESINVRDTIVTAPLTVVVPITVDVQNAQICVSAASSGDQSCTQMILNPEQNSYEAVNVDLSDPASVPAVTTPTPGVSKTPPSERAPVINLQIMIPIETDAQTAQICVTILSSGSQSCQQVVLDPETGM
jgi:hypothetical protein